MKKILCLMFMLVSAALLNGCTTQPANEVIREFQKVEFDNLTSGLSGYLNGKTTISSGLTKDTSTFDVEFLVSLGDTLDDFKLYFNVKDADFGELGEYIGLHETGNIMFLILGDCAYSNDGETKIKQSGVIGAGNYFDMKNEITYVLDSLISMPEETLEELANSIDENKDLKLSYSKRNAITTFKLKYKGNLIVSAEESSNSPVFNIDVVLKVNNGQFESIEVNVKISGEQYTYGVLETLLIEGTFFASTNIDYSILPTEEELALYIEGEVGGTAPIED